ncbi:hypothetical protein [Microbacterium sp.]|uniref:hypothetical protein n=1 Tax=Microbacterium sp. TaxID=51671 RepID=UPI00261178C7|nr:hypothetical protein [Microbacterium sp.]
MSDPQQPQNPPYASQPAQQQPPQYAPQQQAQPAYAHPAQPTPGGYGQPSYTPAPTPSQTGANPMGKIGFILGLVSIGVQVLLNLIIQIMIRSDGYQLISLFSNIFSIVIFLTGVGGLVFGLIGIKRPGAPHALSGIAAGIGITIVIGAGMNFIFAAINLMRF